MVAGRRRGEDDRIQNTLAPLPRGESALRNFESAERGTFIHSLRVLQGADDKLGQFFDQDI